MSFKSSKHFKYIPSYDNIPKHIKEKWYTNPRLIHKKVMLKTDNLKINNGIYQGDSYLPLFFIVLIPLNIELNLDSRYTIATRNKPTILYGRFKVISQNWWRFRRSTEQCEKI